MSKVASIYNQSVQTSQDLANGAWPAFLRTAAWNYRYSFPNQVLIYAQRPDATACASMADWNNKLQRRVNAGAAGIALLEESGDSLRLNYIFDVADTHSPSGAQVPIWSLTEDKEEDVRLALADAFLPGSHPYRDDVMVPPATNFYYEVAHYLCDELAVNSVQDILSAKESCEALQNLSEAEVEWEFKTLLETSVASIIMHRCGLEPDVDPAVWESAKRYQDLQAMAILGQATQNLARQGLEVARYAVRKWDKEHKEERRHEQEQHNVSEGRSVQDPGTHHSGAEDSEPVRQTSQAVPEVPQAQPVHADDAVRGSDGSPSQHRDSDGTAGDRDDGRASEENLSTAEAGEQPELDAAYRSPSEAGRRDDPAGDDLRLTEEIEEPLPDASEEGLDPGFPTVEEQEAVIEASVSELNFTQDEVDSILNQIIETKGAEEKLISVFLDDPNSNEAISALREAFEPLDDVYRLGFSDEIAAVAGRPYGIEIKQGGRYIIPWNDVATYFQKQAESLRSESRRKEIIVNPVSSNDLQEGQVLNLSGTQYRVNAIYETSVSLQDVDHPLFTQNIAKNILDILLRPKVSEIGINPAKVRGEESPDEAYDEPIEAISAEVVSFDDTPIEEFLDAVLLDGTGFVDGKLRIYGHYQEDQPASENTAFLKKEYGIGGGHVSLGNGNSVWRSEDSSGLTISRFVGSSDRIQLSWSEVAKRISQLISEDRYLDAEEKQRYQSEQGTYPQPVDKSEHNPEPYIDHPELIVRDVSQLARQDKVVLTDLLMHFINYRNTYSNLMPALSAHDAAEYLNQRESLENMAASDSAEENRQCIQETVDFFNRWFVPFAEVIQDSIQRDMTEVLTAAEEALLNWDKMVLMEHDRPEKGSEAAEALEEVAAAFTEESFHVGDFYEDAFGRGVISHVSPEEYDGGHKALFSFSDPDAEPGSRAAKGFVMDMATAIDRLNNCEATLIPSEKWRSEREAEPSEAPSVPEEPSLFDFTFDEPAAPEKEPVISEPVAVNAVPNAEPEDRRNFKILDMDPDYGGKKARFRNNLAAIHLLKDLEEEQRLATPAEQEALSYYVGWGGLSEAFDEHNQQWQEEYKLLKETLTDKEYISARESTLTAFYTPPAVTEAIYDGLRQLGFSRGNILDPCCGTGHFFGMLPEDMSESRLYGVELDNISGRISRQLYQNANIVIEGYEKTSLPDAMFDVAVGNVPFGNFQLPDRRYDKEHFLIHDYFFAKTLDKVRPGGVIAFVTSKGTLDKENDSVRKYIAHRADLLGAIRLPDNTFKNNAGTEVVSDIIFLRKRERPTIEDPYWVGLDRQYQGYDQETGEALFGPSINAYFVDNPEMVLGDLVEVSGPHGPVITCKAREGEDLRTQLKRAIRKIEGSIGKPAIDPDALDNPSEARNSIPADPNVRNFSYTVVDGDIYFREDSLMFRCEMNKTAEKRVKGMVNLRNITRDLIQAQIEGAPDAHVEALQAQLNAVYDEFSKKHGLINSTANSRAFSEDSSYYLLCSLENLDEEGNFLSKADIFTKRTIGQHKTPEHVETAQEALAVSLGERASVDLAYMSQLSDISEEKLISDLKGLVFPVPGTDRYEISHLYLSGNVREKLQKAKEAAEADPRFLENVAHLEKALPEPLEASDISVRLGTTWIPPEDYKAFLIETLKLPYYCESHMDVTFEPYTCSWSLTGKNLAPYSTLRSSTYGTGRMDALDIFERTLNLRDVQVYDTKTGPDGETHRVLNGEETLAAQEKQQQMKDLFSQWIWKDPDRRERLCNLYNEKYNSIVPPSFSADLVQFHGLNPMIDLAPHQKESVARILYSGNTLLAHTVGAGKTWTMTAAAMESKYLGLCNKSLVVVPNHLIGQWAAAIYEAYPQANVLASTEKDFEPANRKKFCSRIATGDYDIVVIGHSHFEKIPLSAERQEATIQKEIDDIMDSISQLKASEGERFSIKKLEAARKSLQTKLDKLHNSKKRDDVITFEELGVDRLFVDESHNYKNLFVNTKMHNVAGISQTDSQKASDMFVKSRYIDEITGGKGLIHGTGSPLSNTMAELYTTQRYLQYDALQKMGLGSFDAWASTFGETVVALELAPEGNGYRPRTRFAKFFNLPELMNMYKQVADIRTKDMLNLPVPAVEYQVEVLKPSEQQKAIVRSFGERADKIRKGGVNNKEDNMLCVTNDGRKVALDQRLIDPTLPDNPNSKTAACAESIFDFYQKGEAEKLTQLVFCDLSTPKKGEFNVYDDLKEKLVAKGIPADEIRYIHEANTVPQKEALFAKVRSGAVRVLMGSTNKMGTGTNVQDRLIAGHDLDAPWRPSDLEQRSGRVIRRGNHNDKVFMRRYVTEGTFDAYMYQLLEIKQRFIDQVFSSKIPARVIDDVDGAALDYAEIKALSSGDPRIKEKVALEMEIAKLEVMRNRHFNDMYRLESKLKKLPGEIEGLKQSVAAMKKDFEKVCSRPSRTTEGRLIPASVKGVTYEKQEDAGNTLIEAAKKLPKRGEWMTIGSLRGFEIQGVVYENKDIGGLSVRMSIAGSCRYSIDVPDSGQGLMTRLNNILDKTIETRLDSSRKKLAACESDLITIKAQLGNLFPDEALLQQKKMQLAKLDEELNLEAQEKQEGKGNDEVAVEINKPHESAAKRSLSDIIAGAQKIADNAAANSQNKGLSYSR